MRLSHRLSLLWRDLKLESILAVWMRRRKEMREKILIYYSICNIIMDNFLHFSSLVVSALLLLSINRGSQRFTVVFLSSHLWVKALETLEHASFIPVNAEIIHLQLMENEKLKSFSFWASLSLLIFPPVSNFNYSPELCVCWVDGARVSEEKVFENNKFQSDMNLPQTFNQSKVELLFFVCKTTPAIFHSAICNYKITRGISLFYPAAAAAASSVVQLQQIAKKREKNCCKVCSVLQFKSLGNFFSFFFVSRFAFHDTICVLFARFLWAELSSLFTWEYCRTRRCKLYVSQSWSLSLCLVGSENFDLSWHIFDIHEIIITLWEVKSFHRCWGCVRALLTNYLYFSQNYTQHIIMNIPMTF